MTNSGGLKRSQPPGFCGQKLDQGEKAMDTYVWIAYSKKTAVPAHRSGGLGGRTGTDDGCEKE